ncbi:anthranilate synthase component I [Lysinibacillus sp. 2017]|uniref:anthranilate synthase component I n=1 Tax=unclassified Lysinibacillus TaxID=2636778 RepID=UPI000D527968|nr:MULTISPECIES: anthranilate synthase component I [unclassified Lysinibacillus]AWE09291.1 anthranilate synthase component I [Lysinibacillus sp. 2017]TGN34902.1 anthranilate synthase component I [Lysinibacillus sp. S2017]
MRVETKDYVLKQINGDTLTPISIFIALQGKNKILFESNAKFKQSGRYSFIACNPIAELKGGQVESEFYKQGQEMQRIQKPVLQVLKQLLPIRNGNYPFAFFGGAIGYFGYETAFHFEQIGEVVNDVYEMPDVHVFFYDTFIVFDHLLQQVTIVAIDLFQEGRSVETMEQDVATFEQMLKKKLPQYPAQKVDVEFYPTIEKSQFIEMVEKAKDHIRRGDIFQIVLSQTFEAHYDGDPLQLYRKLRTSNASPYMYYIDFGNYTILGTSPESLVKVQDRIVTTNPIAGTKPRGQSVGEDEAIAEKLLQDEKEIAEHKMLVDLGRNDVGRVAQIGTVEVTKFMEIERYKFVMHIVSEVKAKLREDVHLVDVLASSLPAGTVSGAPKIRAMQLINELEKRKRGVYAGAVGYLSTTGNMDLALAIRTMVVKDEKAYVQAGAGIVYDSLPEMEYEETLNKAKALLEVRV